MHYRPHPTFRFCCVVATAAMLLGLNAGAQTMSGPSAKAELSTPNGRVGEPLQLSVRVSGGSLQRDVPQVNVDGLLISFTGHQTEVQQRNLSIQIVTILTYLIIPEEEGSFEIPALSFLVDGQTVSTEPLMLTVGPGRQPSASLPSPDAGEESSEPALMIEVILPERDAFYVGELIPVQLRLAAAPGVEAALERSNQPLRFVGTDFTSQDLLSPENGSMERNGRRYSTLTFQTSLSPVKAGELTLPSIEVPIILTSRSQARRRSPMLGRDFDPFNPSAVDQLFEDFFADDPFGGMGLRNRVRRVLRPEERKISVKPLPTAGRPADFQGAVGRFQMEATASPTTIDVGDPLTVVARISGEGNFNSVSAPTLQTPSNWRQYNPSSSFTASNPIGSQGTKEFQTVVVPGAGGKERMTAKFSFFDPIAEQYEQIESPPMVVEAIGQPLPPQATTPVPAASVPGKPAATPDVATQSEEELERRPPAIARDILHIQTGPPGDPRSFRPPWLTDAFVFQQLILVVLSLFAIGASAIHRGWHAPAARERREKARQRAELLATLRKRDVSRGAFYAAAATYVENHLQAIEADLCDRIFKARDFSNYGGGKGVLEAGEREEILAALRLGGKR